MFRKIIVAAVFSTFALSNAYASDIGDVATAVKSVASLQGNAAIGVNTAKDLKILADAAGSDSSANAGLSVVDSQSGVGGKGINLAVGVNTGEAASITATAAGSGANANAGLGVIRTRK